MQDRKHSIFDYLVPYIPLYWVSIANIVFRISPSRKIPKWMNLCKEIYWSEVGPKIARVLKMLDSETFKLQSLIRPARSDGVLVLR